MKNVHKAIIHYLSPRGRGRLLDAACGEGGLGSALEDIGFEVYYFDKYEAPQMKKHYVKGDFNQPLPYEKDFFDYIIFAESLQYAQNQEQLFREFNRILRGGGALIVSFPNILTSASRLYFLRRGYFQHFKPYRTIASHKEWDYLIYNLISFVKVFQLMKNHGFELIDVMGSDTRVLKGLGTYYVLKLLYLIGLPFEKNQEKKELIRHLSSKVLLMSKHIGVCGVKKCP